MTDRTFTYAHAYSHYLLRIKQQLRQVVTLCHLRLCSRARNLLCAHCASSEPQPRETEVGKEHRARTDTHGGHRVLASMARGCLAEGAQGQNRAGGGTGECVDGKGGKKEGSAIRTTAIARCTRSASARLHSGARAKDNNASTYGSSAPVHVSCPEPV